MEIYFQMLRVKRQKIKAAADRNDAESVDDAAVVDDMFDFLSDMSTAGEQSQSGPTLFKDLPAPKNIQGGLSTTFLSILYCKRIVVAYFWVASSISLDRELCQPDPNLTMKLEATYLPQVSWVNPVIAV